MKITELIMELRKIHAKHGDLEVMTTDYNDYYLVTESIKVSMTSSKGPNKGALVVIIDTVADPPLGSIPPSDGIPGVTKEDVEEFLKEIRR